MKKVLVSGVTGFIGSHISKLLLDQGYLVVGISRLNNTSRINELKSNRNFELIKCDIMNYNELLDIVKTTNPDIIIHTAALLPKSNNFELVQYYKTNVCGTYNLLQSACKCNVRSIIYTSTMNVYGIPKYLPVDEFHSTEPVNEYGITKLTGEMFCKIYSEQCGINTIVLRYSGVFGPMREDGAIYNFIECALANKPLFIFSDGSDVWDTVHVDDAIKAIMLAIENIRRFKFEILNVGYGKEVNLLEIANKVVELTKSNSKIVIKNKIKPIKFYYDISKAQKLLRFTPLLIEESINNFIRYIKLAKGERS